MPDDLQYLLIEKQRCEFHLKVSKALNISFIVFFLLLLLFLLMGGGASGAITLRCGATITGAGLLQIAQLPPADLGTALTDSVQAMLTAANGDTNKWNYWPEGSNCWMTADISGLMDNQSNYWWDASFGWSRDCVAIGRKHVVGAEHILSSDRVGHPCFFYGSDRAWHTNSYAVFMQGPGDICIYELASNLPPSVKPFALFPPNITNCFKGTPMWNAYGVWFRNNTSRMNVVSTITPFPPYLVSDGRPSLVYTELFGTAGDSGAPVFYVLHGRAILAYCVLGATPDGPFLSYPDAFSWVIQACTNDPPEVIDLSPYIKYQ